MRASSTAASLSEEVPASCQPCQCARADPPPHQDAHFPPYMAAAVNAAVSCRRPGAAPRSLAGHVPFFAGASLTSACNLKTNRCARRARGARCGVGGRHRLGAVKPRVSTCPSSSALRALALYGAGCGASRAAGWLGPSWPADRCLVTACCGNERALLGLPALTLFANSPYCTALYTQPLTLLFSKAFNAIERQCVINRATLRVQQQFSCSRERQEKQHSQKFT